MAFLSKSNLVVKKTPLIDGKCGDEVIQMQQGDEVWTARGSYSSLIWTTLSTFLLIMMGMSSALMLYRNQLAGSTTQQRYTRFCTVPIKIKDSALNEPNYRVMPVRWSTSPDVQVFSVATDDVSDDLVDTLREEFDIGDTVEKIKVMDNGRQVSFIHDFDANITGIVDMDRCFAMDLDNGVVVPPGPLMMSISHGALFDVSPVRSSLRAELGAGGPVLGAPGVMFVGFEGPLPHYLLEKCNGKPLYRLKKDGTPIIRKRAADAPSHDYIQFSGRHVQEIEITNLADLLQREQDSHQ